MKYYAADNAPQGRAIAPIEEVKRTIVTMQPQFKAALPAHIPVEKFSRVVNTAIAQNPKLVDCNRASLFTACLRAAADGLMPDGKESALVQFGNEVVYMPMVAGVLKKIRNSYQVSKVEAILVYSKDSFSYNPGVDEVPQHAPDWFGDRGTPIGVYGVAKLKDGNYVVEIMSKSEIEQIRNSSRSKDKGPWVQWWSEMARKSVLRRLAKYLPQSTDREADDADRPDIFDADDELNAPAEPVTVNEAATGAATQAAPKRRTAARAAAAVGVETAAASGTGKIIEGKGYTVEEITDETAPADNKDPLEIPKELRRDVPAEPKTAEPAAGGTPEIPL